MSEAAGSVRKVEPQPGHDVTRKVDLAPDPSILTAIGAGHSLATAMADLIDNSIDKGATRFLARFITREGELIGIRMHDDGAGMSAAQLEKAMRLGARRDYGAGEHGHFGVGLKAASFSQAERLTVYSRCGYEPTRGMRLVRGSFRAEVLDSGAAQHGFAKGASDFAHVENGTVVEWDHLHSVFTGAIDVDRRRWLESVFTSLGHDLGLTFHRILARKEITVVLQQFDTRTGDGVPVQVLPVDPFSFPSGAGGYPLRLVGATPRGAAVEFTCHIMQPAYQGPAARLLGRPRSEWQGVYVYRNDRLQHSGGWLNLLPASANDLQLARVAVELTDDALTAFRINPEKNGVVVTADGVHAIEQATAPGSRDFRSFLAAARDTFRVGTQRDRGPKPVARIAEGLPQAVIGAMDEEFGFRDGGPNLKVLWKPLGRGRLFELDHPGATVWLNEGYRAQLQGVHGGDAAFFKTSIVLQLQDKLERGHLQQSTIDQIERVHAVLAAATFQQIDEAAYDDGPARAARATRAVPDGELDFGAWEVGDEVPLPTRVDGEGFVIDHDDGDLRERWADIPGATADPVQDYLRHIGKVALLNAEQEVELAMRIEAGLFAEEKLSHMDEEGKHTSLGGELSQLVRAGRQAKTRFVHANLRLVVSLAKRYTGRGMDFLDLIQEGNIGLIHAVEKFDHTEGNKFSTYATWWIRQAITRAMADRARIIRIPVHTVETINKIKATRKTLSRSLGREPHPAELSRELDMTEAAIAAAENHDRDVLSIDGIRTVMNGEHLALSDVLIDANAPAVDSLFDGPSLRLALEDALQSADGRESLIIRMRHGIGFDHPHTLDEIGNLLGVTRERIRQIEKKTMGKLRGAAIASTLDDFRDFSPAGVFGNARRPWESDTRRPDYEPETRAWIASVRARRTEASPHAAARFGPIGLSPEPSREERDTLAGPRLTPHAEAKPAGRHVGDATVQDPWADYPASIRADVEAGFREGVSPADIAAAWAIPERDVTILLSSALFGLTADATRSMHAERHGARYSDAEVEMIATMILGRSSVTDIARKLARTPFAIAAQIVSREALRDVWLSGAQSDHAGTVRADDDRTPFPVAGNASDPVESGFELQLPTTRVPLFETPDLVGDLEPAPRTLRDAMRDGLDAGSTAAGAPADARARPK
jgi:RNA polymerase sigma factor (sigma-70 family)